MGKSPRFVLSFLLLCVMLVAGCGHEGPRRPLSGSVTYRGQPIDGTITFLANGRPVGGALIRAGQFTIPAAQGLEPGTYLVAVSVPVPGGERTPEEIAAGASPRAKESLPAKYNAETTLTIEVTTGGPNEFPLDLQ